MKRNPLQMLLAALLAVTLMLSAAPVATAAGSISDNYDAVVSHIEENGSVDEETGWKYLDEYYESEGITIGLFLISSDAGLKFDLRLVGDENSPIISETYFLLEKTNNNISVEYTVLLVLSEDNYDMVSSTKSIDRTTFPHIPSGKAVLISHPRWQQSCLIRVCKCCVVIGMATWEKTWDLV